ncbi:MAG: SemiSWEET family transporter [bacterium]
MLKFLEILTGVTGLVMSIGYYLGAWKIVKHKTAEGVSRGQYLLLGIGCTIWLFYGLYVMDWVIISGYVLGFIGSWLVFSLTYIYKKKGGEETK